MADSAITYGLDFYTRLERKSFGTFPEDSLVLALRWIAPSDSNYVDTLVVSLRQAAESVRGLGVIFKRNQWATTN